MPQKFLMSLAICLSFVFYAFAQDTIIKWQKVDFSKKILTKAELSKVDGSDLPLLRGLVFGKRGRGFAERSIQEYLEKQSWYKQNKAYSNKLLSTNERKNIDLIREAEANNHNEVRPGDLRFWAKKDIPDDKILAYTSAEWSILIAEFEAIHGKTFSEEWLQKYFDERYWYKPNLNYSAAVLTEIERKNLEKFVTRKNEARNLEISFGDMDKFQDVLLKQEQLKGMNLNELRLIRNEVFARRGKRFTAVGDKQSFEWQDWYKPIKDQSKVKLNATEESNIKLILATETGIREKLSTEVLAEDAVTGLFAEDLRMLRNEIFAKRGFIFKDPKLQKYFSAQPWYVKNTEFKLEMLTEVELKNITTIKNEEELAISKFVLVEG
jgi:YARHG domain